MWQVYIVRCGDASLYTGITNDLENRLRAHNSGRGAKYTRSRRPVRLLHRERFATKARALCREAEIKRLKRCQKLMLIAGEARPAR